MKFDVAQGEKHHTEKAISFETPHEKQLFLSPVALFFEIFYWMSAWHPVKYLKCLALTLNWNEDYTVFRDMFRGGASGHNVHI